MLVTKDEYEIDDDPGRVDLDVVQGFLSGSYWAEGVPRDVVKRSVANSLNLGLYHGGSQVGLTRAVTDRATFAWVADVFVLPAHRVYADCGFTPLTNPGRFMEIKRSSRELYLTE